MQMISRIAKVHLKKRQYVKWIYGSRFSVSLAEILDTDPISHKHISNISKTSFYFFFSFF